MGSTFSPDLSDDPSVLRTLSPGQRDRLATVLDEFLAGVDDGMLPNASKLIEANPDLAEPLAEYLGHLENLHDVAAGFVSRNQADDAEPTFDAESLDSAERQERRIGDFILEEEIGRGGMGVVYRARQISLGRSVALKLLPFAAVLNAKQIARFKNEAQAAAHVSHPNIVPVFAVGAERGVHYYAMQLIEGQPLDKAIAELRMGGANDGRRAAGLSGTAYASTRNIDDTIEVARNNGPTRRSLLTGKPQNDSDYYRNVAILGVQAAKAIHAAHEYGIVHRDIKPSNLLIDQEGKLWITDFGLARFQTDRNLTKTGDVIGTLRYMSPEQARGRSALVDHRTDVYSLGVTLYEMLTLRTAFNEEKSVNLIREIDLHDPRSPRQLRPEIPIDLESIVLKAIAKSRDDRYATAEELADDLKRFIDGKATVARPPTLLDKVSKWARRHQRVVLSAAGVAILLCGVLGASTVMVARAGARSAHDHRQAKRDYSRALRRIESVNELTHRLSGIPGTEDILHELQMSQLSFYEGLAQEHNDEPKRLADVARAHGNVGKIHSKLGRIAKAIAAHEKSIQLLEELSNADQDSRYRAELALAYNNLGTTLLEAGQLEPAQLALGKAINIQSELAALLPKENRHASDLALTLTNLGLLHQRRGNPTDAIAAFQRAKALQDTLLSAMPNDVNLLERVAATQNCLGSAEKDPAVALAAFKKAAEHCQTLGTLRPGSPDDMRTLAMIYNNQAALHSRNGDLKAAQIAASNAIAQQQQLVAGSPRNHHFKSDLAFSHNNLALVQNKQGKALAAIKSFQQALYFQKQLTSQHPTNVNYHSTLAGIYNNLGIVLEEQVRYSDASKSFDFAIEHQRAASDAAPKVNTFRTQLSKHYFNHARVLRRSGSPAKAAELTLLRKELWSNVPDKLFSVAKELALAVGQLRTANRRTEAERFADTAVATLSEAVNAGLDWPLNEPWPPAFDVLDRTGEISQIKKTMETK